MQIELRKTSLPEDAPLLREIDVRIFGENDAFEEDYWLGLESYWIVADGQIAGSTAFSHHVDFQEDVRQDEENVPQEGTLYLETTGILSEYRRKGLGAWVKIWQIEYARRNGFERIVTNCRESNSKMISINQRYGFKVMRITPAYYGEPVESTVVMELLLQHRTSGAS
jgi:GNAT superfamily N-acetyltransferase